MCERTCLNCKNLAGDKTDHSLKNPCTKCDVKYSFGIVDLVPEGSLVKWEPICKEEIMNKLSVTNTPDICKVCENHYNPDSETCKLCHKLDKQIEKTNDPVNHPNHYQTKSGLETIQVIEAFTEDLTGIEAVYTGNVIKYICRWKKKNGLQDLWKAQWYLNHLIEKVEEKENK